MTAYQDEVTHAQNTRQAAIGARQASINARYGIQTPVADQLFAQGEQHLSAGDQRLNAHHPNLAAGEYATAHDLYSQSVQDAENKRAQDAANAAAARAAAARAAAAAQQAAIAQQQAAAAAAAAAARTAQQAAAAKAAEQAAQQAKQAAAPALAAAEQAVQATPGATGRPAATVHPAGEAGPIATIASPVGAHSGPGGLPSYPGLSQQELDDMYATIVQGVRLHAPKLAILAILCIGAGENHFSRYGCNSSNHCGYFQLSAGLQAEHDYHDVAYWADRAYRDGFWSYPGLITLAERYPSASPGRLANMCQGAYDNLDQGAAYYDQYTGEAARLYALYWPRAAAGGPPPPAQGQPSPLPQPAAGSSPAAGGVFNLFDALSWAGDFDNLFKYMQGGANEAAHMSGLSVSNLSKTRYIPPA